MAGPERTTEDAFVAFCLARGVKARKLKDAGNNSWPDRSIILPGGRMVCVEFKSPAGKLSPGQVKRIEDLRALGVPVLVTADGREAQRWLLEQM